MDSTNSPSKSSILVRVDYVASDSSDREDHDVNIPSEKTASASLGEKSKHKKRKLPPTPDIEKPSLQITEPPKKRQAKSVTSPLVDEAVGQEDVEEDPLDPLDLPAASKSPKKRGRKPKILSQSVKENATAKENIVNNLHETANSIDISIQQEENPSVMITESPQVPKKRGRPKKTNLDATPKQVIDEKLNNEVADSILDTSHHEGNLSLAEESPRVPKKRGRKPKSFHLDAASASNSVSQQQPAEKVQPPTELILEVNGNSVMDASCDDLTPDTPTNGPKKRGRKPKTPQIHGTPMKLEVSTPPATPVSVRKSSRTPKTPVDYAEHENTPSTSKRTKKPAAEVDPLSLSDDEAKTDRRPVKAKKVANNVVCGACKEEMPEPSFIYHKYKMHHGLARLEGESQEFTDKERSQELKKTIEKLKRVTCAKCPKVFTTWGGLGYHLERCGRDATELESMSVECEICGKRVMALAAHLKIHTKNALSNLVEDKSAVDITSELLATPGTKSKRAAAQKAVKLIREVADDAGEVSKKEGKKALGMFVEPPATKVTNSIIGAWKRQIAQDSVATCRYTSCTFTSDNIALLSAHHIECEIGLKTKAFACRKCSFHCPDRNGIIEHVLNTHVSEKDAAFEMSGAESSNDDANEDSGRESVNEDEDADRINRRRSIPQNTKILDKAYGLPASILMQFKSMTTPPLIPMSLAQFQKQNFTWNGALYQDWRPKIESVPDLEEYLPTQEKSIPFARRVVSASNLFPTSTAVTYEQLSKFHGVIQTTTNTPMFFCGGAIQSAVWCPMPMPMVDVKVEERDQYLAVSVFKDEDMYRSPSQCPFESKYAVQIWNCGKLRNSIAAHTAPSLELLLAHSFGRVWSLAWCPSGCYDESRLGVLAAACSDGSVRVFSVPHPHVLSNTLLEFPCNLQVSTVITLQLSMNEKSECTTLHWDETSGHRYIVAGFANGIVALWNLQAKSPSLLNGDVLYPVWSFYAHNSIITSVSLSPHHNDARFLATASSDRSLKLWDRFDSAGPVCWSKRSRITNIKWRRHWPGVVVCVEDYYSLFKTASLFYDFGYTGNRQALLSQNSVAWCAAENEYMDIIAHCTDAGEIVIYASHLAVIDCDEKKLKKQRKIVLRTDLVDVRESETVYLNRMDKILTQNINKKTIVKKEIREAPQEYSLIFNDVTTVVRSVNSINSRQQPNKPSLYSEMLDVVMPCDKPLSSLKQISFNPNFECHTWMFACGENGLVQLLRIDSPSLPKIADTYLKELNK